MKKQKEHKTNLIKLLEEKKRLDSAVNASIRALDQVIFTNTDIDEYIANYNEPLAERHNSSNRENK